MQKQTKAIQCAQGWSHAQGRREGGMHRISWQHVSAETQKHLLEAHVLKAQKWLGSSQVKRSKADVNSKQRQTQVERQESIKDHGGFGHVSVHNSALLNNPLQRGEWPRSKTTTSTHATQVCDIPLLGASEDICKMGSREFGERHQFHSNSTLFVTVWYRTQPELTRATKC